MRVLLLGTGSAEGWPNAFCGCQSCADMLRRGTVRRPTSALVDGTVLLDCGPETPRAALQAGVALTTLRAILLTHDHPDHSSPMALLARDWATSSSHGRPLTVVGSPATLARWRPWTAPDTPRVRFVEAAAGDRLGVDGPDGTYAVDVLAAGHRGATGDEGVLYLLTAPDGSRLLYATDTGPLPEPTVAALGGGRLDLLLLEETFGDHVGHGTQHLDLATFGPQLDRLRASGIVDAGTEVVAVHLSHHNPPDLDDRLAGVGARAGHDLEILGGSAAAPMARTGLRTLVLGAARSGKSSTAERLIADLGAAGDPSTAPVTYVATGPLAATGDAEWSERVLAHRARRPESWRTVETDDVAGVLATARGPVLVDCLTLWLTSVLDGAGAWEAREGWRAHLEREVTRLADAWTAADVPVVAVSNEVGAGVVPASEAGRLFRDEQGRLNTRLAATADRCLLVVAGRVLDLPPATAGPVQRP